MVVLEFYPINRNLRTDMKNERSLPGDDVTIIEPRPTEGRRRLCALLDLSTFFDRLSYDYCFFVLLEVSISPKIYI